MGTVLKTLNQAASETQRLCYRRQSSGREDGDPQKEEREHGATGQRRQRKLNGFTELRGTVGICVLCSGLRVGSESGTCPQVKGASESVKY